MGWGLRPFLLTHSLTHSLTHNYIHSSSHIKIYTFISLSLLLSLFSYLSSVLLLSCFLSSLSSCVLLWLSSLITSFLLYLRVFISSSSRSYSCCCICFIWYLVICHSCLCLVYLCMSFCLFYSLLSFFLLLSLILHWRFVLITFSFPFLPSLSPSSPFPSLLLYHLSMVYKNHLSFPHSCLQPLHFLPPAGVVRKISPSLSASLPSLPSLHPFFLPSFSPSFPSSRHNINRWFIFLRLYLSLSFFNLIPPSPFFSFSPYSFLHLFPILCFPSMIFTFYLFLVIYLSFSHYFFSFIFFPSFLPSFLPSPPPAPPCSLPPLPSWAFGWRLGITN